MNWNILHRQPNAFKGKVSILFSPSFSVPFLECLELEASVTVSVGVDFNDSTQAASFQLW